MRANEKMYQKIYNEGSVSIDDVLELMAEDEHIDDFIANHIDGFQVETIYPNFNGA